VKITMLVGSGGSYKTNLRTRALNRDASREQIAP
jgi:hypothetical protein